MAQPNAVGGPIHHSILDGIITGIFGPSTDEMTPEEGAQVDAQRKKAANQAYDMATSARRNPGAEFMDGPSSVGGPLDILKLVGGIGKLFGG
jgi:hypothetical protein